MGGIEQGGPAGEEIALEVSEARVRGWRQEEAAKAMDSGREEIQWRSLQAGWRLGMEGAEENLRQ